MTDRQRPSVSAVVPVYNGARFIAHCIETLLAQDYPDVEVIIVDDGSTDGTPELIRPPVRLLSTGGRKGAGAARNLGARAAIGEFLFFTDSDVEVPPDWISRGMAALKEHGVPCGGGGYAGPVKQIFIEQFAHEELVWRRRNQKGYVATLVSNNLFCRKDVFLEAGGFPENYKAASSEDMEFSWAVSRKHRLWWDEHNGVYHNYTDTLRLYLRQQFRFARDAVPMLLGNAGLLTGKTHHGRQLYIETALTGLFLAGLVFPQVLPSATAAGLVLLVNAGFLRAGAEKYGLPFAVRSSGVIFLRNSWIISGILKGLLTWIRLKIKPEPPESVSCA